MWGLTWDGLGSFVEIWEGLLKFLYFAVVFKDENVVFFSDSLDGSLCFIGLLVVGVDDFEVAGQGC